MSLLLLTMWGNVVAQTLEGKVISTVTETKVATLDALADGYYLMRNVGRNYFVSEASAYGLRGKVLASPTDLQGGSDESDLDYVVYVKKSTNGYTFKFESGQYMPSIEQDTHVITEATETPVEHTVAAIDGGDGQFSVSTTDGIYLDGNDGNNPTIVGYKGTLSAKGNNAYEFYAVELKDAEQVTFSVTFTISVDGTARAVGTVSDLTQYVGSYIDVEEYLPEFTKLTDEKQRVVAGTTRYEVPVEHDLPFTVSESFDNAVWQTVLMHSNYPYYWQYAGHGEVTCVDDDTNPELSDRHLWAFVGNILDGFKVYNRAAGQYYTLNKPGGGARQTNMSTKDENNLFMPKKSAVGDNYICFQLKGDSVYLNRQGNKIATWEDNGAGSSCAFAQIEREVTLTYVVYQHGDNVGSITKTLKASVGDKFTPSMYLPEFTHTHDHNEYVVDWDNFEFSVHEDVPFTISKGTDNLVYQYWKMHKNTAANGNNMRYLQYDTERGAISFATETDTEDESGKQLWAFVGNIFDGFKIYNKLAGKEMTLYKSGNGVVVSTMSSETKNNVFHVYKNDGKETGYVCFKMDGDTHYLNLNHSTGQLSGWEDADAGSSCSFEFTGATKEVTLQYLLKIDNSRTVTLKEETVNLKIGQEIIATVSELPAFTKAADATNYIVSEGQDKYVFPVVQDLPFTVSESFAEARWHNVLMHTDYTTYYWMYDAEAAAAENVTVPESNSLEDKHLWAFVGNLFDGFKIYNKAAGANMTLTKPDKTAEARSYMSNTGENNVFKLYPSRITRPTGACFKLDGDDYYLNAQNLTDGAWTILGWDDTDQGSSCRFFYKPEVTVTRILVDENGEEITRDVETSIKNLGEVVEVEVPDFTTTSDETIYDAGEVENDITVTLTQETLPFKLSTDLNTDVYWTSIRMEQNNAFTWEYNKGDSRVTLTLDDTPRDHQLWAIMGNILDGFKFYNKGMGPEWTLRKAENGETELTMSQEDNRNAFKLLKRGASNFPHAGLKLDGDDYHLNAHHDEDADGRFIYYLGAWHDLDTKSVCEFQSPGEALRSFVRGRMDIPDNLYYIVRDMVGFPLSTISRSKEIAEEYTKALNVEYELDKLADLRQLLDEIMADTDRLAFKPENKRYRIVNQQDPTKVLTVTDEGKLVLGDWGYTPQSVVTFEPTGVEGKYYIQIQGAYLKPTTLNAYSGDVIGVSDDKEEAGVYTVGRPSDLPPFLSLIKDDAKANNTTDHDCYITYADGGIKSWRESLAVPGAHWYLMQADTVEVKLSAIGDACYSSGCYSFPVTMPEGVDAYVGSTEVADATLTLTKTSKVAAREGFVYRSETAGTKKVFITEVDANTENYPTSTLLGTLRPMGVNSESDVYIFGYKGNEVGFYWLPVGTLKVPANKAYLENVDGAQAIKLRFSNTTDLHAVDAEGNVDNSPVYDLSGRVVSEPVKGGIYIKNGKKVILK